MLVLQFEVIMFEKSVTFTAAACFSVWRCSELDRPAMLTHTLTGVK